MRYLYDLFRWRFVSVFWISVWWLRGAPLLDLPDIGRWGNTKWAWRCWRDMIMFKHEKQSSISLDDLVTQEKITSSYTPDEYFKAGAELMQRRYNEQKNQFIGYRGEHETLVARHPLAARIRKR